MKKLASGAGTKTCSCAVDPPHDHRVGAGKLKPGRPIPPELEARIKDVLIRLMMLAEGSTTSFDTHTSQGTLGSIIPLGFREGDAPPKRDTAHPFVYWSWRFARAFQQQASGASFLRLYQLAERDYWVHKYFSASRKARRQGMLDDRDIRDGGLAEREAAKRVVDEYEGVSAGEVAYLFEDCSVEWVKKARRMNGRNPNTGVPQPEFLDLDEEERRRVVAALVARGMGSVKIAERLRVATNTVKKYWPESVAAHTD